MKGLKMHILKVTFNFKQHLAHYFTFHKLLEKKTIKIMHFYIQIPLYNSFHIMGIQEACVDQNI